MTIKQILLLVPLFLAEQTPPVGSITYNPIASLTTQTPASIALVAGSVSCNVISNAVPATGIILGCFPGKSNSFLLPVITMIPNQSFTFDQHLNGDAVTITFQCSSIGAITWQATVTPSGASSVTNQGSM